MIAQYKGLRKFISIFTFCFSIVFLANSQPIQSIHIGGIESDLGRKITIAPDGSVYIGGGFKGFLGVDTVSITAPDWAGYVYKLDSNYKAQWAKQFYPGTVSDVGVLSNGNLVVLGSFDNRLQLDTLVIMSRGSDDIFLACYSPDGQFLWHMQIGSTKSFSSTTADQSYALAINDDDRIYISGEYVGSAYFDTTYINTGSTQDQMFVAAVTNTGDFLWEKHFVGGPHVLNDLVCDADGNPAFCGRYRSFIDLDTIRLNSYTSDSDGMLVQLDENGNVKKAFSIGHSRIDNAISLDIDKFNRVCIGGIFQDTLVIGRDTLLDQGQNDAFFFMYDLNADTVIWTRHGKGVGLGGVAGVTMNDFGYTTLNFYFADTAMIGNDTILNNPMSIVNVMSLEYDSEGKFVTAHGGGKPSLYLTGGDIAFDGRNIHFIGSFRDSIFQLNDTLINQQVSGKFALDVAGFKYRSACFGLGKSQIAGDTLHRFCSGDSIILKASGNHHNNKWIYDGTTVFADSLIVKNTSDVLLQSATSQGCELSISNYVKVIALPSGDTTSRTDTICYGDYLISPLGDTLKQSGSYYYQLSSANTCDSILEINLNVNPLDTFLRTDTMCQGSYLLSPLGDTLRISGTYYYRLQAVQDCDSVLEYTVQVNIPDTTIITDSLCHGKYLISLKGDTLNKTGKFKYTLTSSKACDSVIIYDILAHPIDTSRIDTTIRMGGSITLPSGKNITSPGIYVDTVLNTNGCDSIITFNVKLSTAISSLLFADAKIYPNPTKGIVNIDFDEEKDGRLLLLDLLGKAVITTRVKNKRTQLDISHLEQGVYTLVLQQEDKIFLLKSLILN